MSEDEHSVRLRADAARNTEQIRTAAIDAFRQRGLGVPLKEIATAASVSKATIYNRFEGRDGLVDAVIDELIAPEFFGAISRARGCADPWAGICSYVRDHRDLQYREPVFLDIILADYPNSPRFTAMCDAAMDIAKTLVAEGHRAGVVRGDFTVEDFHYATVSNALMLRHWPTQARDDYDRRTRFFLESLRTVVEDGEN
ncbi:TetR/AcrR family transcriptional regulator [Nocardia pseudovaccinii]|uniref:TetR/AcrR family transcriptional regulator n=1 Tax=Nocardia pseudovaccinii TaxID=189540 RepID=UPI0007A4251F|nr:TetR/AcrR family transcriptional regulator [Nocardia pseudovaccinii]